MIAYAIIYLKRSDDKGGIVLTYGIVFLIIIFLVLFIIAAKTCYVKAPPNVAYIISGLTKNPRMICTPNTGHPVLGVLLYELQL